MKSAKHRAVSIGRNTTRHEKGVSFSSHKGTPSSLKCGGLGLRGDSICLERCLFPFCTEVLQTLLVILPKNSSGRLFLHSVSHHFLSPFSYLPHLVKTFTLWGKTSGPQKPSLSYAPRIHVSFPQSSHLDVPSPLIPVVTPDPLTGL